MVLIKLLMMFRLANQYGGEADDWSKMVGETREFADGSSGQVHWYENVDTGKQVNDKVKYNN